MITWVRGVFAREYTHNGCDYGPCHPCNLLVNSDNFQIWKIMPVFRVCFTVSSLDHLRTTRHLYSSCRIFIIFKIASCFAIENKTMKNKSKPRYNKLVVYHNTRYWTSKYLITMRIWYVCYKVRLQPFWLLVWEQWKDSVLVSTAYSILHTHVTAVMHSSELALSCILFSVYNMVLLQSTGLYILSD